MAYWDFLTKIATDAARFDAATLERTIEAGRTLYRNEVAFIPEENTQQAQLPKSAAKERAKEEAQRQQ